MLQRYDITSVFLYDREYRRLQARNGFRWRTEVGHLQSIWLREGQQQPARNSATIKAAQTATKAKGPMTTNGRTLCKMYNTKAGCSYVDCKFAHTCSRYGCEQEHCAAVAHDLSKKLGITISPNPGLILEAWKKELVVDTDKKFLLNGIEHGFDIVDTDADPMPAEVDNNKSAQCHSPLYDKASQQVLAEIQQGNYVVCEDKPTIISPFSVLEKSDGGVRLDSLCQSACGWQPKRPSHFWHALQFWNFWKPSFYGQIIIWPKLIWNLPIDQLKLVNTARSSQG